MGTKPNANFLACPNICTKCILGLPFVCSKKLVLSWENNKCTMDSKIRNDFGRTRIHHIDMGKSKPVVAALYSLGASAKMKFRKS